MRSARLVKDVKASDRLRQRDTLVSELVATAMLDRALISPDNFLAASSYRLRESATEPFKNGLEALNADEGARGIDSPQDAYENASNRPGTTDKQRDEGRAALDALESAERRILGPASSLRGNQATVLGSAISRNFREGGGTSFIGRKIETIADPSLVGQVVCNPSPRPTAVVHTPAQDDARARRHVLSNLRRRQRAIAPGRRGNAGLETPEALRPDHGAQ